MHSLDPSTQEVETGTLSSRTARATQRNRVSKKLEQGSLNVLKEYFSSARVAALVCIFQIKNVYKIRVGAFLFPLMPWTNLKKKNPCFLAFRIQTT